jgi:hypothetical protein
MAFKAWPQKMGSNEDIALLLRLVRSNVAAYLEQWLRRYAFWSSRLGRCAGWRIDKNFMPGDAIGQLLVGWRVQ